MVSDKIGFKDPKKDFIAGVKKSGSLMDLEVNFGGYNEDIVESYYWHLNFAYFTGKGYVAIKFEDHHYFSENSQFGTGHRQQKGNTIRAFQENLSQMIALVKTHLIPMLREVQKADFYKEWLDKITINDEKIWEHIENGGKYEDIEIKEYLLERDEAISHIKDKWVTEVDSSKLWMAARSTADQGLDFNLTPQLFFGVNLPDPFQRKSSLKEQLDKYIYPIETTVAAKENVARYMYRFYTWLPTIIRETTTTFKIKVNLLKQMYSQLLMYADFMKPLLMEIQNKKESLNLDNFFRGYEIENPDFANLFDNSYSYVKIAGANIGREGIKMENLDFTPYGFYIASEYGGKLTITQGKFKGRNGYILGEKDGKYMFLETSGKNISYDEFINLKKRWDKEPVYLEKLSLKTYPVMIIAFGQKRKNHLINTPQGAQNIPFMINNITYKSYAWNIFELAVARQESRVESLDVVSTFIEEIAIIREELMKYVDIMSNLAPEEKYNSEKKEIKKEVKQSDLTLFLGPIQGLGIILSPLIPNFGGLKKAKKGAGNGDNISEDEEHLIVKLKVIEDTWKMYSIHKKTKGLMQF